MRRFIFIRQEITIKNIHNMVLLQSLKTNHTTTCFTINYDGIPSKILISVQTEKPKRVPSFRLFLYIFLERFMLDIFQSIKKGNLLIVKSNVAVNQVMIFQHMT